MSLFNWIVRLSNLPPSSQVSATVYPPHSQLILVLPSFLAAKSDERQDVDSLMQPISHLADTVYLERRSKGHHRANTATEVESV